MLSFFEKMKNRSSAAFTLAAMKFTKIGELVVDRLPVERRQAAPAVRRGASALYSWFLMVAVLN